MARNERKSTEQGKLNVFTGVEWLCRDVIKEVANSAVDISDWSKVAEEWEEWKEDDERGQISKRSEREEKFLWRMLDEADKVLKKEERKEKAKKVKKIQKAREKMASGKSQPSILDKLKKGVLEEKGTREVLGSDKEYFSGESSRGGGWYDGGDLISYNIEKKFFYKTSFDYQYAKLHSWEET